MKTKLLKIANIVTTAGTQIRAKIDTDAVDQYAEAMQDASNKFPAVVVFHDGSQFVLADGFHRVMAASRNGFVDIEADVRKGTKADALKFALSANVAHGLRRTNADKRRSVVLALEEWPKLSDREIARICAVSQPFVGECRRESTDNTYQLEQTRIGADGRERRMPAKPTPPAAPGQETPPPADSSSKQTNERTTDEAQLTPEPVEPPIPGGESEGSAGVRSADALSATGKEALSQCRCALEDLKLVIGMMEDQKAEAQDLAQTALQLSVTVKALHRYQKEL